MGIRLTCPNGHPLHVKSELAGKRGICPECQARFVIPMPQATHQTPPPATRPTESLAANGNPAPAAAPAATATPVPAPAATIAPPQARPVAAAPVVPPAATPLPATPAPAVPGMIYPPALTAPVPVAPAAPQGTWYVRPSAGGQYGPADEMLLRQWIAERRVDAAALVWCAGWPDWRRLSEVPGLLPPVPVVAPAGFDAPAAEGPAPAAVATARYIRRKKRSANSQLIAAGALLLLALVLGGVLLWVLNKEPAKPTTPPATPVEPAPPAEEPAADDAAPATEQPSTE